MNITEHTEMLRLMKKAAESYGSIADEMREDSPMRSKFYRKEQLLSLCVSLMERDDDGPPPAMHEPSIDHHLKILPTYFEKVLSGEKVFEIRKDDRGFKPGQIVRLYEINPGPPIKPTGREAIFRIGFISSFAQREGYVVFSLLPLTKLLA